MVVAPITARFQVKVGGAPLPRPLVGVLASVVVENRADAPDHFIVTFRDNAFVASNSTLLAIGKQIEISVSQGTSAGSGALMNGEITALEIDSDETGTFFIVRGFDKSHRLHRGRKTRSFLQVKYSDIAMRLASEVGLIPDVEATSTVHEYVVQANMTNFQLLKRLAAEVGYQLSSDGRKLSFRKPAETSLAPLSAPRRMLTVPQQLVLNENLFRLNLSITSHQQPKKVAVHGWDPEQKRAVTAQKSGPSSTTTEPRLGSETALASPFGDADFAAVGIPYRDNSAAQAAADGIAERLASASVHLTGVTYGDARLKAGQPVTIAGAGDRLSGKYTLTATRHVYDPFEGYRTEIAATGAGDPSLYALTGGLDDHLAAPPGRVEGVVPAVVTDNNDPKNQGRIRVKFPWLPKDPGGQELESAWARVASTWAGNQYGSFALPEVNDEVLVAFEHGDMRYPYVVGGLYNGKDKPKFPAADMVKGGKVVKRGMSTPAKHRLIFDEADSLNQIELSTGDDNYYVKLDKKNKKITVECKESGSVMEMKSGKDIAIEAVQGDLTLKAKGKITLDATGDVSVSSKANVKLSAQAKAEMSGQAGVGVKSSGMAEVKGATVSLG
jgi:uncharacterized protein involved in type VI secretion and phage assembly